MLLKVLYSGEVPVELWTTTSVKSPTSPHARMKNRNLCGHSQWFNCSGPSAKASELAGQYQLCSSDNSSALWDRSCGSCWKFRSVHSKEVITQTSYREKTKSFHSPQLVLPLRSSVRAASGRHGGLCWPVSFSLLVTSVVANSVNDVRYVEGLKAAGKWSEASSL